MIIEIPALDVILSWVAAFVTGLVGLSIIYKVKPYIDRRQRADPTHARRLEYYERQLIDMKIRLDALDLAASPESKGPEPTISEVPSAEPPRAKTPQAGPVRPARAHHNITEHVLHLITQGPMTSRDIQTAIGRTREHTSRLMKKMYEEELVKRHTTSKPYAYSITPKGSARLAGEITPAVA